MIFVFIVVDSFLRFSASFPPRKVVFYSSRDGLIDHIFSFQPCLTCPQLPSVVVFAFVAPTKLRARTPPRGVRPLHTRRTASDAELHAPAPVGGFRRRPCRRVARGNGGQQVGEGGPLLRAPVLAFPRSHVFGLLRNYAPPVALRRQPSYRHLSSVHHSRGGYSAEEPQPLRRLKDRGSCPNLAPVVISTPS